MGNCFSSFSRHRGGGEMATTKFLMADHDGQVALVCHRLLLFFALISMLINESIEFTWIACWLAVHITVN